MTQKEYLESLPLKTKEALELGKKERIEFVNYPKFIRHPKVSKLFSKLEALMREPKRDRIRSLLLVGDSNNGKTAMVRKFADSRVIRDDREDIFIEEVMYLQAPNRADLHDLYNRMFQFFVVPYRENEPVSERENKIRHYCEVNHVRMIIIDEIQGALIGSRTKQMEFMSGIKNLSNLLRLPIVLVGTPRGVSLVSSDHQMKSRFVPTRIRKWILDEDYLSLLYAIERTLPLKKPSGIYGNEKLYRKILELSDGLIGDIMTVCGLLAAEAIASGKERIETGMLGKIEYVPAYDKEGVMYADEI